MASLWGLGGLTWKNLGKRVWNEIEEDDIFGRAAQLAYYFLLALFPLLLFLTSVIGLVMGSGTGLRHSLFNYLGQVLPGSASQLVSTTMSEVSAASGGGKVAFGILAALWAASNGMGAITQSLNVAYDVEETRPWWKQRLTAVGLTLALSVLIISALVLVLYGGRIADHVAGSYGFGEVFTITWKIVQWPIVLAFMLLAFALIYYLAPDLRDQKWAWVTPGAAVGVGLWLLVSFGFRLYLHFFDSYSKTYGALGAVIVLMLWLYLTGAAILIGGEVNSEIENAAAKAGAPDAKEKGEKTPAEKEETGESGRSIVTATTEEGKMENQDKMTKTPAPGRTENESLPALIGRMGEEVMQLLDTKLSLLKVELKEEVDAYVRGGVMISAGGMVAAIGFALLNVAIAFFVSTLFEGTQLSQPARYALGFVITGAVYLVVGAVMIMVTKNRLAKQGIVPTRTVNELEKDKQWLKKEL